MTGTGTGPVIDHFHPERRKRKKLKKTLALMLSLTLGAGLLSGCVSTRPTTATGDVEGSSSPTQESSASGGVVNVYNWGEYIDESVLEDFTAQTGIKVNYQMYDSNETMYSKLAGGGAEYDVIIPSDYMIARLIEEDMLEPLNFDNIPNFSGVRPGEPLLRALYVGSYGRHLQYHRCG